MINTLNVSVPADTGVTDTAELLTIERTVEPHDLITPAPDIVAVYAPEAEVAVVSCTSEMIDAPDTRSILIGLEAVVDRIPEYSTL